MPCGCKGGSWKPPSSNANSQTQPSTTSVAKGARAPGYFAPSRNSGAVAKK